MIVRIVLLSLFFFHFNMVKAQDTTFVRSFYQGTTVHVPNGKKWKIEQAFISANDGYNIKISQHYFNGFYASNEKLVIPYYCAEMELLDNKNSIFFLISIKESDL